MEPEVIHQNYQEKLFLLFLVKNLFLLGTKVPKFNEQFIPRWPPNSPDLSGIEIIWSIIKQMLILFPPKDLDSLKSAIKTIWKSIPKTICENIIEHIKHRWELCIKYNGRRIDRELLKKIPKV